MSSTAPRAQSTEAVALRVGSHTELGALADAVLGAGRRHELGLLDVATAPDAAADVTPVDVVWAGPDDVSRLHHGGELAVAVRAARTRLRAGGLLLLPAPEPAELKSLHAVAPVAVQLGPGGVAGPVGVWDFTAGGARSYSCQLLSLCRSAEGWMVAPGPITWFEVPTEQELRALLADAGYRGVQRLSMSETGLSCTVWAAVAPSSTPAGHPS